MSLRSEDAETTKERQVSLMEPSSKEYVRENEESLTDRFAQWMEAHIVHGASVPRKLVQKLPRPCLPDSNALVPTTGSDFLALGIPACLEQITLLPCGCSVIRLYASVCRRKWSYVPCSDSRIVRV